MNRCSLCPGVHKCLPPDGPEDSELLFIGEAPGIQEERKGHVFIGKTGDEVNRHYLPLAGLRRDAVRFTNAIRCLPTTSGGKLVANRAADTDLLFSCAERHLYPELERYRLSGRGLSLLIPLGSFACRAVFGESFDLELRHGIPTDTPWGIPAFPMYHPALGIHEPKKMLYIRTDWDRLRRYLKGTLVVGRDSFSQVDYQEVTDEAEIQEIDPRHELACDTESRRGGLPFCLTYSQQPGTGRLIRSERSDLLQSLDRRIAEGNGPILFHNFLYDWEVTEKLGLYLPYRRIVDTMARVFHLGNLPQGLKALAFRECGMTMQDFDDVVTPYSRENVLHYYDVARTYDWPKPDEELKIDEATGLWKLYRPQSMSTKLKRFFTDYSKNPEKDVFDAWENWESSHEMIEAECGPWPGKCISHVPFEKVLYYACRDADALFRVWPIIKRMSKVVRKFSQERWREQVA